MKITRRELAVAAGAAAIVRAQTAPVALTQEAQAEAAREASLRASESLTKFEIPMATEPAFQFKA